MRVKALAIALALALTPAAGAAQDYDAGQAAYYEGDYATALHEWRPLAEQGHAGAQNSLGVMYEQGQGVAQDYAEAERWYHAAAEQGDGYAQGRLGLMYKLSWGVAQDYVTAHMWFNIAAANGNLDGPEDRDELALEMTAADISEAERRASVCMESNYQDCD